MRGSTHVFATDLVDEGFDAVLSRVRDTASLDGVTYAGIYHHARDIFPHNPARRVVFHEGGACYFRPSPKRHAQHRIQPKVSTLVATADPLARLLESAARAGLAVRVWTNNLHNTALGIEYADASTQNVFGDRYPTGLCPANPDVRAYVCSVSADIAEYGPSAIIVESACYQPFQHGYHHERSHYSYSPAAEFLLGMCFCEHCAGVAKAMGVAVDDLTTVVRRELESTLAGQRSVLDEMPLLRDGVSTLAGGEMGGFLDARQAIVTGLVEEVVSEVRRASSTRVLFMDWSGGLMSYRSGEAAPDVAASRAWQDGADLSAIARICDGLAVLGYTRDAGRVADDLAVYRGMLPDGKELSLAVRPMTPDCLTLEDLFAKVAVARRSAVEWLEFYHYGLMRLSNLAWVGQALTATSR